MAITLVTIAGVSFRGVSKIFIQLNICLHLNFGSPTHTTILNWTKKQGLSQFKCRAFYQQEKWVLIADESIQFGNKKLLLVLAIPESRCNQSEALSRKDITPLVLKVSDSWKAEHINKEIKEHIDLEQIAYFISDTGSNLTCAFQALSCIHIPDVNHKFSLIVKSVFEENRHFDKYTKALSSIRTQKSISKIARIVPPNQRIMCRFMNLFPLFEWGIKMIQLLEKKQLLKEEEEALSFLKPLKAFITDTFLLLNSLRDIQTILKVRGFNAASEKEALSMFSALRSKNASKIKEKVRDYFADLTSKVDKNKASTGSTTVCCSSDIIESCFGKYKEMVRGNKAVGISDLCLCITAMLGINDSVTSNQAMENIKIKNVKDWRKKNVSKTLFAEKMELNKKTERICKYKT